jgi:hypothetical protein
LIRGFRQNGFRVGEYYIWIGPTTRPQWFNDDGKMDLILEGKPLLCTKARIAENEILAMFEGLVDNPYHPSRMWGFKYDKKHNFRHIKGVEKNGGRD